jgi:tetratricopeptide (TPR) repeat protein
VKRPTLSSHAPDPEGRPKRLAEAVILGAYLVVFAVFLVQSRLPAALPPRWRLTLVNKQLMESSFFKVYAELLEKNPDDPDANWVMGAYHEKRGECDRAVPLLERALTLGRLEPELYDSLVRCTQSLGQTEKARTYAEELARRFPDYIRKASGAPSEPVGTE